MAKFLNKWKNKVTTYKTKAEEIRAMIEDGAETIRDIRADVEGTVEDLKADSEEKIPKPGKGLCSYTEVI